MPSSSTPSNKNSNSKENPSIFEQEYRESIYRLIEETVVKNYIVEDINLDPEKIIEKLKAYAATGLLTLGILTHIAHQYNLPKQEVNNIAKQIEAVKDTVQDKTDPWVLVTDSGIGTVYNAVPAQCKADCRTTANNFRLNLKNPASHRIVAIERTMEKKWGIKQGDVIKVEGAGDLDGIWQVQDRMNKRFAGKEKIDFLVNNNRKHGMWNNLKIYKLRNPEERDFYKKDMAPQLPNAKPKTNGNTKKKV